MRLWRWIQSWRATRGVWRHPDFQRQLAEYDRLWESGELFEGMGFSKETIAELTKERFSDA